MTNPRLGIARLALALALCTTVVACDDDPTGVRPGTLDREYAVVLNSVGLTLTVFPIDSPDSTYTIPLGPEGTPGSMDVRGRWALVPLGTTAAVAVIDLAEGVVTDVVPLPAGSGATGVAIVDDSLAIAANPELGTVTPIHFRTGTTGDEIEVGVYPTALIAHGTDVYVLEANLVNFVIQGPSTVTVIDAAALAVTDTFSLGGVNAGDALISGDSVLYVLNRGEFGMDNGSVSVVRFPADGEDDLFPAGAGTGTIATLAGDLLVSSYVNGLLQLDAQSGDFVFGPGNGVTPDGAVNLLAAGTDSEERIYAVAAGDCTAPGQVFVWEGGLDDVDAATPVTVGSCPIDVLFTTF